MRGKGIGSKVVLSIFLAVLLFQLGNLADANQLPSNTSVSTGSYPTLDFVDVVVFSNPGSQTITFSSPTNPVKTLFSTVTTYVNNANLFFTIDGIEYSYNISPNSNTQLTFNNAVVLSNIRLSIDGRGYSDDAGHVGYIYGTVSPPQDYLPAGTSISTGQSNPGIWQNVVFSNPGPQTKTFPNPDGQLSALWVSVTTYVQSAVLYFDSGGVTYTKNVSPNSNTLLTFANPLDVSNVIISIQDRGYSDDASDIGYVITTTLPVDSDGDGIPDTSDSCPQDPQNDVDDDGVCGDVDSCPNEYGTQSDGCPVPPPTGNQNFQITYVDNANDREAGGPNPVWIDVDVENVGSDDGVALVSIKIKDPSGNPAYEDTITVYDLRAGVERDALFEWDVPSTAIAGTYQYSLLVSDFSGKIHHDTGYSYSFSVSSPPDPVQPFDFALSLSPQSEIIDAGNLARSTLTLGLVSGTSEQVSLSCSVSPSISGECTLSPSILAPPDQTALKITTSENTPDQEFKVTIIASSSEKSKSIVFTFNVNALPLEPECRSDEELVNGVCKVVLTLTEPEPTVTEPEPTVTPSTPTEMAKSKLRYGESYRIFQVSDDSSTNYIVVYWKTIELFPTGTLAMNSNGKVIDLPDYMYKVPTLLIYNEIDNQLLAKNIAWWQDMSDDYAKSYVKMKQEHDVFNQVHIGVTALEIGSLWVPSPFKGFDQLWAITASGTLSLFEQTELGQIHSHIFNAENHLLTISDLTGQSANSWRKLSENGGHYKPALLLIPGGVHEKEIFEQQKRYILELLGAIETSQDIVKSKYSILCPQKALADALPEWYLGNNIEYWLNGLIDENDILNSLNYLVSIGITTVTSTSDALCSSIDYTLFDSVEKDKAKLREILDNVQDAIENGNRKGQSSDELLLKLTSQKRE